MSEETARFWDERYRREEAVPEQGPAGFLIENVSLLPPSGRVLDVAMGSGRNALYLASLGYEITGVDISPVAVARCRTAAEARGLHIEAVCADLETSALPDGPFDIVLNFYYLQRDLCPRLAEALRPGGVLVFESFTLGQRVFGWGPQRQEHLLRPGELPRLFPDLGTLVYCQGVVEGERGKKAVAGLIARKGSLP